MNWRWRKTLPPKGFNLSQLVSIYTKELSGVIWSRKYQQYLPVYQIYEDVMNALHMKNTEGVDVFKSVREKILGKDWFKSAPQEYWDALMLMDLGYDYDEWHQKSLTTRAKIIAVRYLKNMVDIITTYYEEMDERQRKNAEKKNA